MLALAAAALAQAHVVRGVVVAANGLPIVGATVSAGGNSAVTAADGTFSLEVTGATPLQVEATGYTTAQATPAAAGIRVVLAAAPTAEEVTVTATAANAVTAAVPLQTNILGAERLRDSAPPNADTLLRESSDLGTYRVNSSLTANPTTQGVALLGTGSSGASRALVLLDGLPLNDIYGGWVDWLRVPDEDLESASVVAGGASPLYGNDALSGVIGLQTRAPVRDDFDLRVGAGELGTETLDGAGDVVDGKLALALRGRAIHETGYVPASPSGSVDQPAGVGALALDPELRYTATPKALFTLSSEYYDENRPNGTALQMNGTRLRQLAAGAVFDWHGVWDASAFDQSEDYDSTFSSVAANRNSEKLTLEQQVPSRATGAAFDWNASKAGWTLIAGASYLHVVAVDNETVPATGATREENGRQRQAGAFAEVQVAPARHWLLTATLRHDEWSNYDAFQNTSTLLTEFPTLHSTAWSPSLGALWTPRAWLALHLSGYESFRAPTLNELYRPFQAGNVLTEANPLLSAERYHGAQLGAVITPTPRLRLQPAYFDGFIDNLVTSVTLSSTPSLITKQRDNLGRVRSRGEIVEGRWQATGALSLWGSYTHTDAGVLSAPSPALVGLEVPHVPRNDFSARLLEETRGWSFSAVERFGGANFDDDQNQYRLPAFWNTDLYLSRSWRRVAPYVAAENLWDRRYAVELTPGAVLDSPRALTAGARITLGSGQ